MDQGVVNQYEPGALYERGYIKTGGDYREQPPFVNLKSKAIWTTSHLYEARAL